MSIAYSPELVERAARDLDLRPPNRDALDDLAQHLDSAPDGAEMIADLATGVGKTYVAGALLDYLCESGIRNVVIVTPGSTIQAKTVANLTPGHPKYLRGLQCDPLVVTLDTLERGQVGDALADPERFKVFIFTVQSLLRPNKHDAFRAHRPHETVGQALYQYLQQAHDLVVIADEHHVYFSGNALKFEAAIADMRPIALIGLTATPHEASQDKVVHRYPLSRAIADGYVKIPVLVSRHDKVSDLATQLADGVALLDAKARAMHVYCQQTRQPYLEPIMFVVAQTIEEATGLRGLLAGPDLIGSAEKVLLVTSEEPDRALEQLDSLEQPGSPIRAVVSVSMLKEGWDVKNIYVIAAVRAMESHLLTEQIMGRGMRLPFGTRTGNPMLDTVEILSHRAFADLLKRAKALMEQTLGERVADALLVINPQAGRQIPGAPVTDGVIPADTDGHDVDEVDIRLPGLAAADPEHLDPADEPAEAPQTHTGLTLATVEHRQSVAEASITALSRTYAPRSPGGIRIPLYLPQVTSRWERDPFALTDLNRTDVEALGRQFADDDAPVLNRKALDVQRDTLGRQQVVIVDQSEAVRATQIALPYDTIESDLVARLMRTNAVAPTAAEANAAQAVARSFLAGAGVTEQRPWSAEHARLATARLTEWIGAKQAAVPAREIREVSQLPWPDALDRMEPLPPADRQLITASRDFTRGYPYSGWNRSVYEINAFHAYSTEFQLAVLFDTTAGIKAWIRLDTTVPLRIPYTVGARLREYLPDFVVIDDNDVHWVVEGKADADMTDNVVLAKRDAARTWVSAVNASPNIHVTWAYLLASESVIKNAPSWASLKSGAQTFR